MILLLYHFVSQTTRTDHNAGKRIEQLTTEQDTIHCTTTETQRLLTSIHLRHDLAKQQQQKGQQDRHADKFQPPGLSEIHSMVEEIAKEHDDGHIDQVVGNQNGGQCTLGILPQLLDMLVFLRLFLVEFIQVSR